ncbi:MAG: hypothetical protein AB7Y46_17315 [Armatimonadota bacterium]
MVGLRVRAAAVRLALAATIFAGAPCEAQRGAGDVPDDVIHCVTGFLGVAPRRVISVETHGTSARLHPVDRIRTFSVEYQLANEVHTCRLEVAGPPLYVAGAVWLSGGPRVSPPWEEAATRFVSQRFPQWQNGDTLHVLGQPSGRIAFGWQGDADGVLSGASVGLSIDPGTARIVRYRARCARLDAPTPELTDEQAAQIAQASLRRHAPRTSPTVERATLMRSSPLADSAGPVWLVLLALRDGAEDENSDRALIVVDALDGAVLAAPWVSP